MSYEKEPSKRNLLLIAFCIITIIVNLVYLFSKKIYTVSTLNHAYTNEVSETLGWQIVVNGKVENLDVRPHKVGDTLEIVHTDSTTSKYIITAIK